MKPRKFVVENNVPLTDAEYARASGLCDAIGALCVREASTGALWWDQAKNEEAFHRVLCKDRHAIDHSILLRSRFRDFPTIALDFDRGPIPDYYARRYRRIAETLPKRWCVRIPNRFGEIGWNIDGYPVNRHTMILQERIASLGVFGELSRLRWAPSPVLAEIGPGNGEFGHVLCTALPSCTLINCDLPECLPFSAIHMAIWHPDRQHFVYAGNSDIPNTVDPTLILRTPADVARIRRGVVSVPAHLFGQLRGSLKLAAAFNFWSFGEMSASTVVAYVKILSSMLGDDGVLIEQNARQALGADCDPEAIARDAFAVHRSTGDRLQHLPSAGGIDLWSQNEPKLLARLSARRADRIVRSFEDGEDRPHMTFTTADWDRLSIYNL
jgi:hypothetical protein